MSAVAIASPVKVTPDGNGKLALEGALNFATVSAALAAIRPHLVRGVRQLDLSRVDHADSAGLALLVECVKETRDGRHGLRFVGVPAQLSALAAACGLSGLLAGGDHTNAG